MLLTGTPAVEPLKTSIVQSPLADCSPIGEALNNFGGAEPSAPRHPFFACEARLNEQSEVVYYIDASRRRLLETRISGQGFVMQGRPW